MNTGGARPPEKALQPRTRMRWASKLYMDGPGLITLTLDTIPQMVQRVLAAGKMGMSDVDLFLFHQATLKLLDCLRQDMKLDEARLPTVLRDCGQHRVVNHPNRDQRASLKRSASARHAFALGRFRRGILLGWLSVDRDLAEPTVRSAGLDNA